MEIPLGSLVKDEITGLEGIAMGRLEWLNGCVRISVQPRALEKGVPVEAQWVDEPQLALVEENVVAGPAAKPGGPRDIGNPRRPDPTR